ncbi:hypothetical protein [Pantoea eucrina]|uniref:hypothetical protein n=1 Tax=Pantoea eucrina TaxID=472693 RepID=UPI00289693CC|nr:hypothetical protein [Pantoea eucrina]
MTNKPRKQKRCAHCKKRFEASRSSVRYCSTSCREAAKRKESDPAKERRKKSLNLAKHPLYVLRQSKFITDLLQQIARHGSVDCLLDFPIEDLYSLWKARGRLAFKTGTQVHIAHLIPCSQGGAYHPLNLSVLPATINQKQGARFRFPKGVGTKWTAQPIQPFTGDHEQLWVELVKKHRPKLTMFAKRHPKMAGTERVRTAQRLLTAPETDIRYLSTVMAMAPDNLSALCERLSIAEVQKVKLVSNESESEKWPVVIVHMTHIQRLRQFYTDRAKKHTDQFLKVLTAFPSAKLPMDIVEIACCARPGEALNTLLVYIAANEHQLPFTLVDILMTLNTDDNLFVTSDPDGSNEHQEHIFETPFKAKWPELDYQKQFQRDEDLPAEMIAISDRLEAELFAKADKNARLALSKAKKTGLSPIHILEQAEQSFSGKPALFTRSMARLVDILNDAK